MGYLVYSSSQPESQAHTIPLLLVAILHASRVCSVPFITPVAVWFWSCLFWISKIRLSDCPYKVCFSFSSSSFKFSLPIVSLLLLSLARCTSFIVITTRWCKLNLLAHRVQICFFVPAFHQWKCLGFGPLGLIERDFRNIIPCAGSSAVQISPLLWPRHIWIYWPSRHVAKSICFFWLLEMENRIRSGNLGDDESFLNYSILAISFHKGVLLVINC